MEGPSPKPNPGPDPERLKIDGDWEEAVSKALKKPRPAEGWPEPEEAPEDQEDNESS